MGRIWFSVGAALMAVAVASGALGAHLLRPRVSAHSLELWETAVRYLVVCGLGLLATGLAAVVRPAPVWPWPGMMLLAGGVLFSGTIAALALGGPRWLGAVTPLGGLLLIAGFVALAVVWARAS